MSLPQVNFAIETRDGYCKCGCGSKTAIAFKTDRRCGWIKGQPLKFILGHSTRKAVRYIVNPITGCWDWQLYRQPDGYSRMLFEGKSTHAHIVQYELKYGKVPAGLELDHLCRNRGCVNPDHLEPVTPAVNARRGNQTKLDMERVQEIRRLVASGYTYQAVADMFGIHKCHVGAIVKRKVWREI